MLLKVVSCVVPPMISVIEALCRTYLDRTPLFVGPGVRTGMPILYDKPQEVGADRIVNAIAAFERTHDTTIVVDFGTANVTSGAGLMPVTWMGVGAVVPLR